MDHASVEPTASPVAHLPLVREIIHRLRIPDVLDELCSLGAGQLVTDAVCVSAMILDILSGRVALYRMEEWFALTDAEVLLGRGVSSDSFNDTRLASALDHLDDAGTDRVLGSIVERYLAQEDRPRQWSLHQDFTSFKLYGVYPSGGDPLPTCGFSKDHRPDLMQLVFGLSLHSRVGIPLVHGVVSGNTSDQAANRDHLAQLSATLADEDEVTVVADCKLVDSDTVGRVLGAGFHLVSLVPQTFSLRGELIAEAGAGLGDPEAWPELAHKAGRTTEDPTKVYRGVSFERPFLVRLRAGGRENAEPVTSVETLRFLVVHSTRLEEQFDKALESKLQREQDRLRAAERKMNRDGFACEADALAAGRALMATATWQKGEVVVQLESRTLKRTRRGRPSTGDPVPTREVWTVELHLARATQQIARQRLEGSCFLLNTDHLEESGWSDASVLEEYRHQYLIEGHTGFRWLKSEAAVAPMFLKTPSRIRALGLVMVLAPMVRNCIQYTLRASATQQGELLLHPFTKQPVDNLTAEMAFSWFADAQAIRIPDPAGAAPDTIVPTRLRQPAIRILERLRVSPSTFCRPPPRRVVPVGGSRRMRR